MAQALSIGTSAIRELDGLFSLNDLHKASGNHAKHQPAKFIRLDQTQALIAEIQSPEMASAGIPAVHTINGGPKRGTYACRELVIAYAAWISAEFHLKVIRVFLAASAPATRRREPRARYHYPIGTADPHDRRIGSAHLTPRVLIDPKNRAPELELIEQLERDGHDVTGAKVRILALRQAMSQIEEMRASLRWIVDTCSREIQEKGKNVLFSRLPDPNDAIDRHIYRDQMPRIANHGGRK